MIFNPSFIGKRVKFIGYPRMQNPILKRHIGSKGTIIEIHQLESVGYLVRFDHCFYPYYTDTLWIKPKGLELEARLEMGNTPCPECGSLERVLEHGIAWCSKCKHSFGRPGEPETIAYSIETSKQVE